MKTMIDIEKRIGREHLGSRLRQQVKHYATKYETDGKYLQGKHDRKPKILKTVLKLLGLFKRGRTNSYQYRLKRIDVRFSRIPAAFDGFRILQLSDIHIDLISGSCDRLQQIISSVDFDLCVITGDFRYVTYDNYEETISHISNLSQLLDCEHGVAGILGNHDLIEMVPGLEAAGIRMLLNESVPVRIGAETVWIAGVDDPHIFRAHDLKRAVHDIPYDAFKILLSHSPEIIVDAEAAGIDYYLCGHTHGGQVCLPGGLPLIGNSRCSRKYFYGAWNYRNMAGYTCRGVGTSGLSVRFFCPPEITLHRLLCTQ